MLWLLMSRMPHAVAVAAGCGGHGSASDRLGRDLRAAAFEMGGWIVRELGIPNRAVKVAQGPPVHNCAAGPMGLPGFSYELASLSPAQR